MFMRALSICSEGQLLLLQKPVFSGRGWKISRAESLNCGRISTRKSTSFFSENQKMIAR
jgi:hypothetical protein